MTLPSILLFMYLVPDPALAKWLEHGDVQLIGRGDLSPEAAKTSPANPGIVVGKFRATDLTNAGLIRKVGDRVRFQIIACSTKGSYSIEVDQDISDYASIVFLEKVPKGNSVKTDESVEVQQRYELTEEAVKITYYGKAAVVYFWNVVKKKWESIGVSD